MTTALRMGRRLSGNQRRDGHAAAIGGGRRAREARCGANTGHLSPAPRTGQACASPSPPPTHVARTRAQWQIPHLCAAVGLHRHPGKLISLPALPLVCWRMLLVTGLLLLLPQIVARAAALAPACSRSISASAPRWRCTGWPSTPRSLANASVAATCIALAPVFLAGVEPLVLRQRFNPRELLLGMAVVPGVALVVGGMPQAMLPGSLRASPPPPWWRCSAPSTSATCTPPIRSA